MGATVHVREQPVPKGLAQAFVIGREVIGSSGVSLVLGTIFSMAIHSQAFCEKRTCNKPVRRFWILGRTTCTLRGNRDGSDGTGLSIEEKPAVPRSNYAVTGLISTTTQ